MAVNLTRRFGVPAGVAMLVIAATCAGCATWSPGTSTREQVLEKILPSAVQIVVEQREGRRISSGSGVVIASRRSAAGASSCFVLTSAHTVTGVAGKGEIYAVFGRHQGAGQKARARLVASRNDTIDLALLRAETDRCATARPASAPVLGQPIWVIGFPLGRHIMLSSGIVSQVMLDDVEQAASARLMVDAPVNYGVSGGGVFDARTGGLIGVVEGFSTARLTTQGPTASWYIDVPVPGQTLVTPLADIRRFLDQFEQADLLRSVSP